MKIHRFYIADFSGKVANEEVIHQWNKVLGLKSGERVNIFDKDGYEYEVEIENVETGEVKILNKKEGRKAEKRVHLYICIPKKDNFEFICEKVTEIGVSEITPVLSARTEKKDFKRERLEKIIIEAAELSGRSDVPKLNEIISISDVPQNVFVFDPKGQSIHNEKNKNILVSQDISVLIGPEGGFSDEELSKFENIVKIGDQILKVETASVCVVSHLLLFQEK